MSGEESGDHLPIPGAVVGPLVRGLEALWRKLRGPEPAQVLARRAEVRNDIRQNLPRPEHNEVPEIIIVNYRRWRRYGELDDRVVGWGASDWFKAEYRGLHDRGMEVYSAIEYVVVRRGKAYRILDSNLPSARKVWVVGRIPYEGIKYIDWEPDPSYGAPRFYVLYGRRRRPFSEVVLYEGDSGKHLYQLDLKYKPVWGGPIKRLRRFIRFARFQLEDRRNRKHFRGY